MLVKAVNKVIRCGRLGDFYGSYLTATLQSWITILSSHSSVKLSTIQTTNAEKFFHLFGILCIWLSFISEVSAAPYVHTQPATLISPSSARLDGMLVRNGQDTSFWFEWGELGAFDQKSETNVLTTGSSVIRVSANISSLSQNLVYQYRLVASNSSGVTYGTAARFTTRGRVVSWGLHDPGQMNIPSGLDNVVGVASGTSHALALKSDGTVFGWGYDPFGSTIPPVGLSNVIAISAGGSHSLALLDNGTVVAWGDGDATNTPPGLNSVIAIASGSGHALALRSNGTVVAWGANGDRQATVPFSLVDVVAIAAGGEHSLALKADGSVVAWGYNYNGQTNVPVGLVNMVSVAGGLYNSLALTKSGGIVGWGRSDNGSIFAPANIQGLTVAIAGGGYHSMALLTNGTVFVWGQNNYGATNVPLRLSNVVAIAAGDYSCVALGNVTPKAISKVLSGSANADTTVTLSGEDSSGEVLQFRIAVLPLTGTLFQCLNGARGDPIVLPNTLISDLQGRVVFVPATNAAGNPYATFEYVASDGLIDSAPAIITINIGQLRPITHPATSVGPTVANLSGMVLPNGMETTAWFEWGSQGVFDQTTSASSVGDGSRVVHISEAISGLTSGGIYQFRLVASNLTGTVHGPTQLFTTGRKIVAWGSQTNVPSGLSNVVSVSSRNYNNVALTANGEVVSWTWSGTPSAISPIGITNTALTNVASAVASSSSILAITDTGDVIHLAGNTLTSRGLTNAVAISAGWSHYLALKSDGTMLAWGSNSYGQTNVPPGLTNIVGIAADNSHSLALTADGQVFAWGANFSGGTNVPASLSNAVAVSSGGGRSSALTADGKVVAWGVNFPDSASGIVAISGGESQSLILSSNGQVKAWGYNNNYWQTNLPPGLSNVTSIAAGSPSGLAVADNFVPQAVSQLASGPANGDLLIKLNAHDANSDSLTCRVTALPTKGSLHQYSSGVRGLPIVITNTTVTDPENRVIFAPVTNDFSDNYTSFEFLANDGEADSTTASVAVQILGLPYAVTQSPSEIRTNSAVLNGMVLPNGFDTVTWFEWGLRGGYTYSTPPVDVGRGGNVVRVSTSISNLSPRVTYQYRIVSSNSIRTVNGPAQFFATGRKPVVWGNNSYGQTNVPASLTNAVAVAGGEDHSVALRMDGKVVAWGANYSGQTNVPSTLSNVVSIAANRYASIALKSDGQLVAWGSLSYVSPPSSVSNVVSVALSKENGLALRADGSIAVWGYYAYGLDIIPSGISNVVAIASGSGHNLTLKADGKVIAWGDNNYGQTNVPSNLTNVVAIACGRFHSLALRSDGSVVAWGLNSNGQTNVPTNLNGVTAIAGGGNHSMAVRSNGAFVTWGDMVTTPSALTNVTTIASGYSLSYGYSHNLVIGSRPPTAFALIVSGYPNHDSVVTLSASDPSNDPLTFRITSLPTKGFLFQYTTNGRGSPITTSNTIVTDNLRRLIFAPEANDFGNPYSTFTYVANDTDADSSVAMVTVRIIVPPAPQISSSKSGLSYLTKPTLNVISGAITNGSFGFQFLGYSNLSYQVWASSNLVHWSPLNIAVTGTNGSFQFLDADATNWPKRFYRLSMPTDRAYNLNFTGQFNATYRVWASTNLVEWTLLGTSATTSNGWFNFLDVDAAKFPHRFYKAGAP